MKKVIIIILIVLTQNIFANKPEDQISALLSQHHKSSVTQVKSHSSTHELDDYVFIFFYRSTCPHCHQLAPVLKDFANYYQVKVISYSTDGGELDGFKGKKMTSKNYQDYFLAGGFQAVVPALFLQNKYTDQAYPVLFGEAEPYQLAQRMAELLSHIKESQNG
ncbi:conjugal transfer protein TraF [Thiotrichales bacterium 19S11-10]|nr:conjugal transfer protein TraF [Thiotrichales bacterium 19S11-10]